MPSLPKNSNTRVQQYINLKNEEQKLQEEGEELSKKIKSQKIEIDRLQEPLKKLKKQQQKLLDSNYLRRLQELETRLEELKKNLKSNQHKIKKLDSLKNKTLSLWLKIKEPEQHTMMESYHSGSADELELENLSVRERELKKAMEDNSNTLKDKKAQLKKVRKSIKELESVDKTLVRPKVNIAPDFQNEGSQAALSDESNASNSVVGTQKKVTWAQYGTVVFFGNKGKTLVTGDSEKVLRKRESDAEESSSSFQH